MQEQPTEPQKTRRVVIAVAALGVALAGTLAGCGGGGGWPAADVQKSVAGCVKAGQNTATCQCIVGIIQSDYPTVADASAAGTSAFLSRFTAAEQKCGGPS
jgi:hypothetical protein